MSARSGFRLALATIAFSICCTAFSQNSGPLDVYVSTSGNDAWSGLLSSPNSNRTDGPKRTIAGGRDALRMIRLNQSPGGTVSPLIVAADKRRLQVRGAVVHIQSGTYDARTSLVFEAQDSGANRNAPIIYKADNLNGAIIDGGTTITNYSKPDTSFWYGETRVDPSIRSQVYVADLTNIPDLGFLMYHKSHFNATWDPASFREKPNYNHAAELFIGDAPCILSQWPNKGAVNWNGQNGFPRWHNGYNFITAVGPSNSYADSNSDNWIYELQADFSGMKTPSTIGPADDIWLRGCLRPVRYREYFEHVTGLNFDAGKNKGLLRIDPITPFYQADAGRRVTMATPDRPDEPGRFTIENSLYELDSPGEYYIDRQHKRLLFIPPNGFIAGSTSVRLSVNPGPIFRIDGSRYMQFDGLTIQDGRMMGMYITNSYDVTVQNTQVRNLGHSGIVIDNSYRTNVKSCLITDIGEGGVQVRSGNRTTLTLSGNVISDNIIRRWGRLDRFYTCAISLDGCGNTALNNTMTDADGQAVVFRGNEQEILNSYFARVDGDSGDSGVCVSNHDLSDHGNVIKGNVFEEISNLPYGRWYTCALFIDGGTTGVTFEGNVVNALDRGVNILPSCDVTVRNNVFLNCTTFAIMPNSTPFVPVGTEASEHAMLMPWQDTLWSSRYPNLKSWLLSGQPAPVYYTIEKNIFYQCKSGIWNPEGWPFVFRIGGRLLENVSVAESPFVDLSSGNFALLPGYSNLVPGWEPINGKAVGSRTLPADLGTSTSLSLGLEVPGSIRPYERRQRIQGVIHP